MNGRSIRKAWMIGALLALLVLVFAACAQDSDETNGNTNENDEQNIGATNNNNNEDEANNDENEAPPSAEERDEPVELLIMTHWIDEQFEERIGQHVNGHFSNIELNHIQAREDEIEELFAANIYPDIIMSTSLPYYNEMDLLVDLNPLIDMFNFDITRLEPGIVESLRNFSNEGELNGFPYIRPEYALVYNQDVFDAFGEAYPEDGMSWDEVIQLASNVTGEVDGVQYRGLHHGEYPFKLWQMPGWETVDPITHEPNIENNDAFRAYLSNLERMYSIPGNVPDDREQFDRRPVNALSDGELAMVTDRGFVQHYADRANDQGLRYDYATFPTWGGEFGEYRPDQMGNGLVITTSSEEPEAAFEVVDFLLSDEHQGWLSRNGFIPTLTSQEVIDQFFMDHELYDSVLQDKNLDAIFKGEAVPIQPRSEYEQDILPYEGDNVEEGMHYIDRILDGQDVNTIVRELEDAAQANYESVMRSN